MSLATLCALVVEIIYVPILLLYSILEPDLLFCMLIQKLQSSLQLSAKYSGGKSTSPSKMCLSKQDKMEILLKCRAST